MRTSMILRNLLYVTLASVVMLFSMTYPTNAGAEESKEFTLRGKIYAVERHSIVIAHKQVNISSAEFQSYDKKKVPFSSFKVGTKVMVIGLEKGDGLIVAQKLILLPSD